MRCHEVRRLYAGGSRRPSCRKNCKREGRLQVGFHHQLLRLCISGTNFTGLNQKTHHYLKWKFTLTIYFNIGKKIYQII